MTVTSGSAFSTRPSAPRIDATFWRGRRVVVTGHTGFKGAWLSAWLQAMGADVAGLALAPATSPSLFGAASVGDGMVSVEGDIRDASLVQRAMADYAPEFVFHLAAQALVRPSYVSPAETYAVNVMGTVNVLEAVRACPSVHTTIVVTSDKCYENREWLWPYREDEPLGGRDPYSSSKACAELVVSAYRASFSGDGGDLGSVATVRAGNVIGGGDWAEDRLVPDVIRAVLGDQPLVLRYPDAVRPWQHVLDPLGGYLLLAQRLADDPGLAGAWNFAPDDEGGWPVSRIVDRLGSALGTTSPWVPFGGPLPHEAHSLRLDASKSRALLGWAPRFSLDDTVGLIANWYRDYAAGADARMLVDREISLYQERIVD